MSNLLTKLTMAALLAGGSAPALAGPGNGIRLGGSEGRLHPFVELEGRYDSNLVVTSTGASDSDFVIHVRPGLALAIPGEMTTVDVSAKLDWAKYTGSSDVARKLDNTIYAAAELGVSVNKKGVVALELNDSFRRSDRPQLLTLGGNVNSNFNLLELRVPIRPGGGALTFNLNGAWALESFELRDSTNCPGADPLCEVSKYGYNELRGGAGVSWKFLPRTSALVEGGYFLRSPNDTTVSTVGSPGGYRAAAGLTGLVTSHLAATLKAGYGSTIGGNQPLGTWLATLEGEWMPTELASVKLGYGRDLGIDPKNVYSTNRVFLEARQLMAGRILLGLSGSWDLLGYSTSSATTSVLAVSPSVGVEVTRWLKAELAYAYTDRSTSTAMVASVPSYSKSEAWLKAVVTY